MFLRAMGVPVEYDTAMAVGGAHDMIAPGVAANAAMTRIQTADMIVRALADLGVSPALAAGEADSLLAGFDDLHGLSAAERENLAICVKLGIFQGAGDGLMNPHDPLLRSQMASLAVRFQDVILGV